MDGHTLQTRALDLGLNHAVRLMAERYAPRWVAAEEAPNDFETLKEWHKRDGYITVWSGASEDTIFGEPFFNHAFRAWHDAVHLSHNLPFTLEGEKAAAEVQVAQLRANFMPGTVLDRWCEIIRCEVGGQAEHFATTGEFPADQIAFAKAYLGERGIAL